MSAKQPHTIIKTRGHQKRRVANALIKAHQANAASVLPETSPPVRIVCNSDTHNKHPEVPLGDILIHAGDLTENGSFEEVQNGLKWLSSQPHKHKVLVAGNHDVLLDDEFLAKYPERRYGQTKTKEDLDWGSVIYLQDSPITLDIPASEQRTLTIFGGPWTPRYGISAFQYHPHDSRHWKDIFASVETKSDIIVTHGPPHLHLDQRDFHRAGCPFLAEEIYRIQPRLHVFGHIHVSYGRQDVWLDSAQRTFDRVVAGSRGWIGIVWMAIMVIWARVRSPFRKEKMTTFVNAAVVGGSGNDLRNDAVVVNL